MLGCGFRVAPEVGRCPGPVIGSYTRGGARHGKEMRRLEMHSMKNSFTMALLLGGCLGVLYDHRPGKKALQQPVKLPAQRGTVHYQH